MMLTNRLLVQTIAYMHCLPPLKGPLFPAVRWWIKKMRPVIDCLGSVVP